MKKITCLLLFLIINCNTYGQEKITLIDFGVNSQNTPGNWNNFNIQNVLNSSISLIDDIGVSTGETLTLTDIFDQYFKNNGGTQTPNGGLPFPTRASRDSFFGENVAFDNGSGPSLEPTGGFSLTGLEIGKYYSFTIFASRDGVVDNREALYTITGNASPVTATLDAANNTSNVATILNIQPNGSGEITIQAETGPNNTNEFGFYYLGAIKMTKSDTTLYTEKYGINGVVTTYPNPSSGFVKISLNLYEAGKVKMNVYDLTGKLVKKLLDEEKPGGGFVETWNTSDISSGIYILKIEANGRTNNSKLILK